MLFKTKEEVEDVLKAAGVEIGIAPLEKKSRIVENGETFRVEYNPTDSPLRDDAFLRKVCLARKGQILSMLEKKMRDYGEGKDEKP